MFTKTVVLAKNNTATQSSAELCNGDGNCEEPLCEQTVYTTAKTSAEQLLNIVLYTAKRVNLQSTLR